MPHHDKAPMHHRPAISDPDIVCKSENKESLQEEKKERKEDDDIQSVTSSVSPLSTSKANTLPDK